MIDWNRGAFSQTNRFVNGVVLGVFLGAPPAVGPTGPAMFITALKSRSILTVKNQSNLAPVSISLSVKEIPL